MIYLACYIFVQYGSLVFLVSINICMLKNTMKSIMYVRLICIICHFIIHFSNVLFISNDLYVMCNRTDKLLLYLYVLHCNKGRYFKYQSVFVHLKAFVHFHELLITVFVWIYFNITLLKKVEI